MGRNPRQILKRFILAKPYFVGINSGGCVFDTMKIEHNECNCPNFIRLWELHTISKYAREICDFVNL
jgi:hypothetical protein